MKDKNQFFSEVFSNLLNQWCKANKRTQADFASIVGVHPNMISRYKKGDAYPTDDVIEWIAQALKVDKAVFFPDKRRIALEEIGKLASDSETTRKLDRMARIIELSDVFQKLKEVYGVPDGWSKKSLSEGFAFISYLDEQIEHAFKTYFKYIDASYLSEDHSEKTDNVLEGIFEIINDCLKSVKNEFPQIVTNSDFLDLLESQENQDRVLNIAKEKLLDIIKEQ